MTMLALNLLFNLWIKPYLVLTASIKIFQLAPHRSPHISHWCLSSLAPITIFTAIVFVFFPLIKIPVIPQFFPSSIDSLLDQQAFQMLSIGRIVLYLLTATYLIGALSLLNLFLYDQIKLFLLVYRSTEINEHNIDFNQNLKKCYRLLESNETLTPFVFGWLRPSIILPADWSQWPEERLDRIILHEQHHVSRNDWAIKVFLDIIKILFWYLPPLWAIEKRISEYAEYACDDGVIREGNSRADYAQDMLDFASTQKISRTMVSAISGDLSKRINLILEGGRTRQAMTAYQKIRCIALFWFIATILFSVSFTTKETKSIVPDMVFLQIISEDTKIVGETPTTPFPFEKSDRYPSEESVTTTNSSSITSFRVRSNTDIIEGISGSFEDFKAYHIAPQVNLSGLIPAKLSLPAYPKKAIKKNIEADIRVTFDIDAHGQIANIRFEDQEHLKLFRRNIEQSLFRSEFYSPRIYGNTISVIQLEQTFSFRLIEK